MNKSIELMMHEHDNIIRMNVVIRNICLGILDGNKVPVDDFRAILDFIKNYSDKHHHGKEEKFLFPRMIEKLGKIADNLISHGMLVEHDLGRSHVLNLTTALNEYENSPSKELKLDIITEAMGYAHLLQIHAEKENAVVYTYAENNLSEDDFEYINSNSIKFEESQISLGIVEKYETLLQDMENKYLL